MKNKVFSLGYYYYDGGSREFILYHENKTKKDFTQDVLFEMKEYAEKYNYVEGEASFIGISDFIENSYEKLSEKGYKKFETISFDVFASNIISEEDEGLKTILGEELFNKIVNVNKKIEGIIL
jgi:hypothetical protein